MSVSGLSSYNFNIIAVIIQRTGFSAGSGSSSMSCSVLNFCSVCNDSYPTIQPMDWIKE